MTILCRGISNIVRRARQSYTGCHNNSRVENIAVLCSAHWPAFARILSHIAQHQHIPVQSSKYMMYITQIVRHVAAPAEPPTNHQISDRPHMGRSYTRSPKAPQFSSGHAFRCQCAQIAFRTLEFPREHQRPSISPTASSAAASC